MLNNENIYWFAADAEEDRRGPLPVLRGSDFEDRLVYNCVPFTVTTVQLNCCGSSGPHDYRDSSWFNHTNFADGAFVPPSCCVLLNNDPKKPEFKDETQCQIEAIMNPNNTTDSFNVKTRVRRFSIRRCGPLFLSLTIVV